MPFKFSTFAEETLKLLILHPTVQKLRNTIMNSHRSTRCEANKVDAELPCVVQKQKSIPSQPAAVAMGPLTQTENNQSCKQTTTLPRWEKQIHCAVALGLLLLVRQDIRSVCKQENLASKRKTHSFVVPRESLWAVPKNSLPSTNQPRDDWDLPPLIRLTKSSH